MEFLEARVVLASYNPGGNLIGIENYTSAMGAGDSMIIDLGGANNTYDQVKAASSAAFDGTLQVRVPAGFSPAPGAKFDIVTATATSGTFSTLVLPSSPSYSLLPIFSSSGLTLVAAAPTRPTGLAQLRVPSKPSVDQLASFLVGDTTVGLSGLTADLTVLGQSISGTYSFGAGLDSANKPVIALGATNVTASFGGGLVNLINGSGTFFLSQSGVAGVASVDASLKNGLSASFNANVELSVNTGSAAFASSVVVDSRSLTVNVPAGPYVRLDATGANLTVGGQEVTGNFALEAATVTEGTSKVQIVRAGATSVSAFFGVTDTAGNKTGIQVTDGSGGFIIRPSGVALQARGNVALVGVSNDLTLSGSIDVALNNSGVAVKDAFNSGDGQAVTIDFTETGIGTGTTVVQKFGGSLDLQVKDFLAFGGTFDIQRKSATGTEPAEVLIGVDKLNAFYGVRRDQESETGLRIKNGKLGIAVQPTTAGQPTPYALTASGDASLVGVSGLTLGNTVSVRKNTTGKKVDENINGVAVKFIQGEENLQDVSGTLDLNIMDSVSLSGGFAFHRSSSTQGIVTTSTFTVGAANVNAFMGVNQGQSGETGVKFIEGTLGLVIEKKEDSTKSTQAESTYALVASGKAALALPSDVSPKPNVNATLDVRLNRTGAAVPRKDITVPVLGGTTKTVTVEFADDNNSTFVGGTLQLNVGAFDVEGSFSFAKHTVSATETKILVGASDVHASLKAGPVDFHINDGQLGMVVNKKSGSSSTYAIDASGAVGIYGLPIQASGTLGLRLNTTGGAVDERILVPKLGGGELIERELNFGENDPARQFSATDLTLGVRDVFSISGDVIIAPGATNNDPLTVDISNAGLAVYAGGEEAVRLGGANAKFYFGGKDNQGKDLGFRLDSFSIAGFDFTPGDTDSGNEESGDSDDPQPVTVPESEGTTLGPLTIRNPSVSLTDFELKPYDDATQTYPLVVTVGIDIGEASLKIGDTVSAKAEDIEGHFGIEVGLTTTSPFVSDLSATGDWDLSIGSFEMQISDFLTVGARDLEINPQADEDEDLVYFGSVFAALSAGQLKVEGRAEKFAILGDGSFDAKPGFTVGFGLNDQKGVGFPSFLPIGGHVNAVWPDFENDPADFTLDISASVDVNVKAIELKGSVEDLILDVNKLRSGEFPILDIGTFSVSAKGDVFGGKLEGSFLGGILKLDQDGNAIPSGDTDTEVADRVFYSAIEAGFHTSKVSEQGFNLWFGLSENGPLGGYIKADVDVNLPAGFVLTGFRGGVFFDAAPLPVISDARDLKSPAFAPTKDLTSDQWLEILKQQVARQAGGGLSGYLFDLNLDIADELVAGVVNQSLHDAVLAKGIGLSSKASVEVLEDGANWLIKDGSSQFLIERRSESLSLSRVLLTLPSGDATALDSQDAISETILTAFNDAGFELGAGSAVAVITTGERWEIQDGDRIFVVSAHAGVLAVTGKGSLEQLDNRYLRIEAGATVYHKAIPKSVLNADTDIIITTDGKFVLSADVHLLDNSQTQHSAFYSDLSGVVDTSQATLLFYTELPITGLPPGTATQTVFGGVHFGYIDGNGDPAIIPANTTPNLSQTPFQITLQGGTELNYLQGKQKLSMNGNVILTSRPNDLQIDAQVTTSLSGIISIPNAVSGAAFFEITDTGFWGAAQVGANLDQLQRAKLFLTGDGFFQVNTTDDVKPVTLRTLDSHGQAAPTNLEIPADGLNVWAKGSLDLKPTTASIGGIRNGVFSLEITSLTTTPELKLFAAGSMYVGAPNAQGLSPDLAVAGVFFIDAVGFAARLGAHAQGSITNEIGLVADLQLTINTTRQQRVYALPDNLVTWLDDHASPGVPRLILDNAGNAVVPAGAPRRDGTFGPAGIYFVLSGEGDLSILSAAKLIGSFYVGIEETRLSIDVDANLKFGTVLSAHASGLITVVYSQGAAVNLLVDGGLHLGALNLEGTVLVQHNSLPYNENGVAAGTSLLVDVDGSLRLTNSFVVAGRITLKDSPDAVNVLINGKLELFGGAQLVISNASASIYKGANAGFVFDLANLHTSFAVQGIFNVDADASIHFDTRSGSFRVGVDHLNAKLFNALTLHGSGYIERANGVFSVDIGMTADFGVVRMDGQAFLSSEGEFLVALSGDLDLTAGGFGVRGHADFTLGYLDNNGKLPRGNGNKQLVISGHANVGVIAFDETIFGLGAGVGYQSGAVYIEPQFDIGAIHYHPRFTIGRITVTSVTTPPPVIAGLDGTTLKLYVGNDRGLRTADGTSTTEDYVIRREGDAIVIEAFGIEQSFDSNSMRLISGDFGADGTGSESVVIGAGIDQQLDLNLPDNDARVTNDGINQSVEISTITVGNNAKIKTVASKNTTITASQNATVAITGSGGLGSQPLSVIASNGAFVDARNSGAGVDISVGGNSRAFGSDFADVLHYNTVGGGAGPITLIGGAGQDTLDARGSHADNTLIAGKSGRVGGGTIYGGQGNDAITTATTGYIIDGLGGADNVSVFGTNTIYLGQGDVFQGGRGSNTIYLGDNVSGSISAGSIDGGTAGSDLILNFTGASDSLTLSRDSLTANGQTTPFKNIRNIDVRLNNGARLTIDGVNQPLTVTTDNIPPTSAPYVTVNSLSQPATIDLNAISGGVLVKDASALLTINGPANSQATLTVDRSASLQPLSGVSTSNSITGIIRGSIVYTNIQKIDITLGQGADSFAINSTAAGTQTTARGNGESDQFRVVDPRAIQGALTVHGNISSKDLSSQDSLTVSIPAGVSPTSNDYDKVNFTVNQFIVDDSADTLATAWVFKNNKVSIANETFFDIGNGAGADTVRIFGNGSTTTLTVDKSDANDAQQVSIVGEQVQLKNGPTYLQGTGNPVNGGSGTSQVAYTGGSVMSSASSPDGKFVYEIRNSSPFRSLVTYAINPSNGKYYEVQSIGYPHPDRGNAQLVMSRDASQLYLFTSGAGSSSLEYYSRNATNGTVAQTGGVAFSGEIVGQPVYNSSNVGGQIGFWFLLTRSVTRSFPVLFSGPVDRTFNLTFLHQQALSGQSAEYALDGSALPGGTTATGQNSSSSFSRYLTANSLMVSVRNSNDLSFRVLGASVNRFDLGGDTNFSGFSAGVDSIKADFHIANGQLVRDSFSTGADTSPIAVAPGTADPNLITSNFNNNRAFQIILTFQNADGLFKDWVLRKAEVGPGSFPFQSQAVSSRIQPLYALSQDGLYLYLLRSPAQFGNGYVTLTQYQIAGSDFSFVRDYTFDFNELNEGTSGLSVKTTRSGVVVSSANRDFIFSTSLGRIQDFSPGATETRNIQEVRSAVVSPDGTRVYAVSPSQSALLIYNRDPNTGGETLSSVLLGPSVSGLLGANSVAIRGSNLYVTSPMTNSVTWFQIDSNGNPQLMAQTGLPFTPSKVRVQQEDGMVYVLAGDQARILRLNGNLTPNYDFLNLAIGIPQDVAFGIFPIAYASGANGIQDFNNTMAFTTPTGSMAFSPDGHTLFSARQSSSSIDVFSVADGSGALTLRQTLTVGNTPVSGLATFDDGTRQYVLAVVPGDNALVAFTSDTSGTWFLADRLGNNVAGVTGLLNPTAVVTAPNGKLVVATDGGGGFAGGLSNFTVQYTPPVGPALLSVAYSGMAGLTVNTGRGNDSIVVRDALANNLTVNTGAGSDNVVVQSTLDNHATTVNLNQAGNTGSSATVFSTGTVSPITLEGGDGPDTFRVVGSSLGSGVVVHGNNAPANSGDTLFVDGGSVYSAAVNGAGNVTTSRGTVYYTGIENPPLPPAFALNVGPFTISEGQSLNLTATTNGLGVAFAWDVSGSGAFADAAGASPTISWATLKALGLSDVGVHTVSVRGTASSGAVVVASTRFTVTRVTPTILATIAGTVEVGSLMNLTLSLQTPTYTPAIRWTVSWGDGTPDSTYIAGQLSTVAGHVYASTGEKHITIVMTDRNGTTNAATQVTVAAPISRSVVGNPTVTENQSYTLNFSAFGQTADISNWVINWGDGKIATVNGQSTSANHTYLRPGQYTILASTIEAGGSRNAGSLALSVDAITPTLTLAGASTVGENIPYSLTLNSTTGYYAVSSWTVAWGDGTTDTFYPADRSPQVVHHVYALRAAPYPITAMAQIANEVYDAIGLSVAVTRTSPRPIAKLVTQNTPNANQGELVQLQLFANSGSIPVVSWSVQWGDGRTDFIPASGNGFALATHSYTHARPTTTYTIQATAFDGNGASYLANQIASQDVPLGPVTVNVFDIAPTIGLSGPTTAIVGFAYPLQLSTVTDPGDETVSSYTVFWGDSTFSTLTAAQLIGSSGMVNHAYTTAGSKNISVSLIDENGLHSDAGSLTIFVVAFPVFDFAQGSFVTPEGDNTHATNVVRILRSVNTDIASTIEVLVGSSQRITVDFAASETFKDVPIQIAGNSTVELDKTLALSFGSFGSGGRAGTTSSANLTVQNDDSAAISLIGMTANEGDGVLKFTLTLSRPVDVDVVVSLSTILGGTTIPGVDYTSLTGRVVTFPAGSTTAEVVEVSLTDDALVEVTESINARIGNLQAGNRSFSIGMDSALGSVLDNDRATVNLRGTSVTENAGALDFIVELSNPVDGPITLHFDTLASGTAAPNTDFASISNRGVTFQPGETTMKVSVVLINDIVVERNESVLAQISRLDSSGRNVTLGTSTTTGTIINDDQAFIELAGYSVSEGAADQQRYVDFQISLSNRVDSPLTVQFSTTDGGTATAGLDYDGYNGQQVTFSANDIAPKIVRVRVLNDNVVEAEETIRAALSKLDFNDMNVVILTPAATARLLDDDSATLSINDVSKSEGDEGTTFTFTLTMSNPVDTPVSVTVNSANGSATTAVGVGGQDYQAINGQIVTFAPGSNSRTVSVTVNGDKTVEALENFFLNLSGLTNNSRAVTLLNSQGMGTINNDDTASLTISDVRQAESNGVTNFTFTLNSTAAIDVPISIAARASLRFS